MGFAVVSASEAAGENEDGVAALSNAPVRGNRIAVVINGDPREDRHLENARRSVEVLKNQGYDVYLLNEERPEDVAGDHFFPPTKAGLAALGQKLKTTAGPDTDLVLYTTGHGNRVSMDGALCLADGCDAKEVSAALDAIAFGRRTVIMDQCFSGNWGKIFLDDPRTLFVAAGSENESTCCGEFAPTFWSDAVPDANGDGVVSWQERYAHAMAGGVPSSTPRFLPSAGYRLDGAEPFAAGVIEVADEAALKAQLGRLQEGQYAIITFSALWCKPCKGYRPAFDRMAMQGGGQHLWLRTENEELAKNWDVNAFPQVVIVNASGGKMMLRSDERNDVASVLGEFAIPLEERIQKKVDKAMQNPLAFNRAVSLYRLSLDATRRGRADLGRALRERAFGIAEASSDELERFAALTVILLSVKWELSAAEATSDLQRFGAKGYHVKMATFGAGLGEGDFMRRLFEAAMEIARAFPAENERVKAMFDVGTIAMRARLRDEAMLMLRDIAAVVDGMRGPPRDRADAQVRLGLAFAQVREKDLAAGAFERALAAAEKIANADERLTKLGEIKSMIRLCRL